MLKLLLSGLILLTIFKKNVTPFPSASFIDNYFLNEHTKFNLNKASKNLQKKL